MKPEQIMDAVGRLPEELLQPVEALRGRKKPIGWVRIVALAACACLVAVAVWRLLPDIRADSTALRQEGVMENAAGAVDTQATWGRYEHFSDELNYGKDESGAAASFTALVVEVNGTQLLVEPAEDAPERKSASRIWVSLGGLEQAPLPQVGDTVRVYYSGLLQETWPATAQGVVAVELLPGED